MTTKKKQLYGAFIKYEDTIELLQNVDMCNLPYDLFGPKFPLRFIGDVDMGPAKTREPLPSMANVDIPGVFTCSNYLITPDTVLPESITELVCLHSINSLGVLIGKIPSTVKKIHVRPKILNDIKKCQKNKLSDTDKALLNEAKAFLERYPEILVTDGSQNLADIVASIDAAANTPVVAPTKQAKAPKPELPIKTDNYLAAKELVTICEEALTAEALVEALQDTQTDIERYIKQAFKFVPTHEMKRESDGATLKCVHMGDVHDVVKKVKELVKADIARQTKSNPGKSTPKKTQAKPEVQSTSGKKGYYFNGHEIVPVKIKKYISKTVWGKILSKVSKNTTALLRVLQDIEDINIDPASAGAAVFVKDGSLQTSPTIEFKNARCLAQGFGTLDDRPRIVWAVSGKYILGQAFFAEHEGKQGLKYNASLNEMNIDVSALNLQEDYLQVSDLIAEYKKSRAASADVDVCPVTEQLAEAETAATPVSEPVVEKFAQTDTRKEYVAPTITVKDATKPGAPDDGDDSKPVADTSSDVPQQSEQPTAEQKTRRPRITRDSQKMYPVGKPKGTRFKPNFDTTPIAEMPEPEWVDIAKVYHEYITLYTEYSERLKIVVKKMTTATDYELRQLNAEIRTILATKTDIEHALKTILKSNSILQSQKRKLSLLHSK